MRAVVIFIFLSFTRIYSDAWSPTPPEQIPGSALSGKQAIPCYGSTLNEFFVAWTEGGLPTYATYNGTWSEPALIPAAGSAKNTITSSFVPESPSTGLFLVTWQDSSGNPYYAEFDGSNWSPVNSFATGSATSVFTAYASIPGTFMGTWVDKASNRPFFSIFNGSWSTPAMIPGAPLAGGLVFPAYDSHANIFLATMIDTNGNPYYATYNGTWSTPKKIPNASLTNNAVFSAFDNHSNIFLATWQDANTLKPFYATYNYASDKWSTPGPINNEQGNFAVFCSFDPTKFKFLATWQDQNLNLHYGIYDYTSNTWTPSVTEPPATIPESGMTYSPEVGIFSACDTATGRFLLGWQDESGFPFYDTYSLSEPAPTMMRFKSWPNPSPKPGVVVTFQVKVTSPSLTTPSGTVTFRAGKRKLGTEELDYRGVAKINICSMPRGTVLVTATFNANPNFLGSVASLTQTVE